MIVLQCLEHPDASAFIILVFTSHKTLHVCRVGVDFYHTSMAGKVEETQSLRDGIQEVRHQNKCLEQW